MREQRSWQSRKFPIRARATALIAASALAALTACGSDDGGETSSAPAADGTISVVFQPAAESLATLVQLNAFAGDFFAQEKLNVTYNAVIPNAAQAAQTVTDNADIAIVGSSGVVPGVAAGRDMVTLAVLTKGPTTQITLSNEVIDRLGIAADAPIDERMSALKGLTLALPQPGSLTDIAVREAMRVYGVEPDTDVTIRPITEPSALVSAMREGQVDGFAFSAPTSVQPVADGSAQVWATLSEVPELADMPWIDLVTSKAYLGENREAATRFVRALVAAQEDLIANPEEASARIKAKYYPDLEQQLWDLSFEIALPNASSSLAPSESGLTTLLAVVNSAADTPSEVTFAQVYDTSVLEEIGAGGS